MLIDMFCEMQRANPGWSRDGERQMIYDTLELGRLADELGYAAWWQVEHHGAVDYSLSSSPEIFLSLLAQNTSHMRLGHAGVLSPFGINHPLKVAERAAWIDILSNGRLELGLARSSPCEWDNFGIDGSTSREQTAELLRMLPSMWNSERFSWDSALISIPELNVVPKPLQRPHPPLWITGNSEEAFTFAGNLGVGVIATTFLTPADPYMSNLVTTYRAAAAQCIAPAGAFLNAAFGCFTFVHCAESRDAAIASRAAEAALWYVNAAPEIFRIPRPVVMAAVAGRPLDPKHWRHVDGSVDVDEFADPDDPSPALRLLNRQHLGIEIDPEEAYDLIDTIDSTIIGDVDTCRMKMKRFEDVGVDRLACLHQFGGLSHEAAKTSVRLVGEELIKDFSNT